MQKPFLSKGAYKNQQQVQWGISGGFLSFRYPGQKWIRSWLRRLLIQSCPELRTGEGNHNPTPVIFYVSKSGNFSILVFIHDEMITDLRPSTPRFIQLFNCPIDFFAL